MDHICDLKPHRISDSVEIFDMKATVNSLTIPLADIAKQIQKTLKNLEGQERKLKKCKEDEAEIRAISKIKASYFKVT